MATLQSLNMVLMDILSSRGSAGSGTMLRDSGARAVTQKPHWPAKRRSNGTSKQACSNVSWAAIPFNDGTYKMTIRLMLKVCSVAALVAIVIFALGPAQWTPRSGLGFEFDHFVGYFFFTLLFCLAWQRPLVVGGALAILAVVLENLQSFLPGRSSYFVAALYSAAGVLVAALLAELFMRAQKRFQSRWAAENR
jgi:VanZ family protein